MKKLRLIYTLILICTIFSACSQQAIKAGNEENWIIKSDNSITSALNDYTYSLDDNSEIEIILRSLTILDQAKDSTQQARNRVFINVLYPEITGIDNMELENKINQLLRSFPLEVFSPSLSLYQFDVFKCNPDFDIDLTIDISCEIIYNDSKTLSLLFEGYSSYTRITNGTYYLTIDLTSGNMISLFDIYDKAKLLSNIMSDSFSVIKGAYCPGGWRGYEEDIKNGFSDAIQKLDSDLYTSLGYSASNNFGFNEDGLFICFDYEDSLDGYVIIRIG